MGKPVQCQWKAIALPSSSWYRKAYGVVVHWRCRLVQAIPRHQAQVSFRITLHACHDCTDATSKIQFRRQPFHTFQRSTKTHRQSIFIGFRSMQCCVRYIALSLTTPGAVWSSTVVFDVSSRPQEQSGHRQWDWRLPDPLSWTGASPRPSWRPLWRSTLNESSWAVGLAERRKKKPHVQILQFCSVRRIELQAETQQMGHLTEHRERTNLTATMPTCTLNLHSTGTNTHRLSRASSHDVTMTTCIRAIRKREIFLVNARPFPEQSSSIATCRVGSIKRGKGLVRGYLSTYLLRQGIFNFFRSTQSQGFFSLWASQDFQEVHKASPFWLILKWGGGGGFRLKPHIEVRFKWMWRDGGCLSERKKRQNGVWVSLPASAVRLRRQQENGARPTRTTSVFVVQKVHRRKARRVDDFAVQRKDKFFFLWWSRCQSTGKTLDLLCQWTLKKRLAGATSEPIPSFPSCACDWEHLDVAVLPGFCPAMGYMHFLAVTCATSLPLSF